MVYLKAINFNWTQNNYYKQHQNKIILPIFEIAELWKWSELLKNVISTNLRQSQILWIKNENQNCGNFE